MRRLGDRIAAVATPIARAVGADCIDPKTNDLRPESPCAKAKERLNQGDSFVDVFWDRFWGPKEVDQTPNLRESEATMDDYIVNRTTTEQIAIKATSLDDAEEKVAKGEGDILSRNKNVTARPRPTAGTAGSRP